MPNRFEKMPGNDGADEHEMLPFAPKLEQINSDVHEGPNFETHAEKSAKDLFFEEFADMSEEEQKETLGLLKGMTKKFRNKGNLN